MPRIFFLFFFLFSTQVILAQFQSRQVLQEAQFGRSHYFGSSGDLEGDRAVITATHGSNPWSYSGGLAYVYQRQNEQWELRNILYPDVSHAEDRFGQNACALSGDWIIVGDWNNRQNPKGMAHIFQLKADTAWEYSAGLMPNGVEDYDHFGNRVAIDGPIAAVSTYKAVYVFEYQNGEWRQSAVLEGDQKDESGFGMSLAIEGRDIVVGSIWENSEGLENGGALYYYRKNGTEWQLQQKIIPPKELQEKDLHFGHSLDCNREYLAVGCPRKDMGQAGSAGAVFLYRYQSGRWVFDQLIYNERFGYGIYGFGHQVSLSGNNLAVSENQNRDYESSVYILELKDKSYKTLAKLQETEGTAGSRYGDELLALSGDHLLVGDPGDDFCDDFSGGCGKSYLYELHLKTANRPAQNTIEYAEDWGFSDRQIQSIQNLYGGDSILFDPVNGDLVFKMRSRKSGLWGLYQGEKELIPAKYDSIAFSGWNQPFTIVEQNGQLGAYQGFYNDDGGLSVPCIYEDLYIYTFEGQYWLAAKRDGKWRWVNWYNGQEAGPEYDYHQELYILKNWEPGW